ncbi:30850_t:CDS:2, partial [Gigaspora margarita]
TDLVDEQYENEHQNKWSCTMQVSSQQASNTVIPALSLTLNTKSSDIGIPLSVLDMISSAPVESKQTISGQPLTPQIEQHSAPDDKVPSFDTKVPILVSASTTISSEETSEGIEIDLNLDMALVTSTIESNSLPKTYSQVVSGSQTPRRITNPTLLDNIKKWVKTT